MLPRQASYQVALQVACVVVVASTQAAEVSFEKDVRPILEEKCVKCHGPEKQKSSYRLDIRATALTGGELRAPNIVPGKPEESPLVKSIAGADPDTRMPPKGELLTATQQATVKAWIAAGAIWPELAGGKGVDRRDWWSLKPMVAPSLPSMADPIDHFIAAGLKERGLTPAPEAEARTLARRAYFDLTGLPPTPEELTAYEADQAPEAYARLVDRLLASPRYGERWARHWLDVVHYGDTHGYDKDKPRLNAWPYRDYVIRALNADKPYARFVEEQIAGDILFPGSRDGFEALGFIAAGPWDLIGHAEVPETKTDGKIARHLDRDDMVANTMGTFTSLTVHCAACHDHKFDPITQEDYYGLQAVFAALDRTDRKYYPDDVLNTRFQRLQERERIVRAEMAAQEEALAKKAGAPASELAKRIAGASKATASQTPNTAPDYGYHSAISLVQEVVKWVQVDLGTTVEIDHVTLNACYDDFGAIGGGFGFPVRFKVECSDDPEFRQGVKLLWKRHDETFMADFPNPGLKPFTTGGTATDGMTGRYVRVTSTKLAPRKGDFIFALAELQVFDVRGKNVAQGRPVAALDSIEAPPRWRKTNLTDGLMPVGNSKEEAADLVRQREALLVAAADDPTKQRRRELTQERAALVGEQQKLPPPSLAYVGSVHTGTGTFMGTGAKDGQPRPIYLLTRGQVTQPARLVGPGALSALTFAPARFDLPEKSPEGARRAALAGWITHPNNPLTWRSAVNRVWQYHFGRGLVETTNDFGHNGMLPSHPELLDWLATDFRDHGGSLKRLHRQIMLSATYRQSSTANLQAEKIDANNALLWRQNRRKLEAEAIRDSVLAASGQLDFKMGGPGWQDFVIEQPAHSPHYLYEKADPADPKTMRRSIYRFIVRSQTQPWMTSLDCADPSVRIDRRNESLSALQALAFLNNGFMLTQAQYFAERVQRERGTLAAQVAWAHQLVVGRAPSPAEQTKLVAFAQANGLPALGRLLFNLNEFSFVD